MEVEPYRLFFVVAMPSSLCSTAASDDDDAVSCAGSSKGRRKVDPGDISALELSKTLASRRQADLKIVSSVLSFAPWYRQQCRQDLVDMGVVDMSGRLLIDKDDLMKGPPIQLISVRTKNEVKGEAKKCEAKKCDGAVAELVSASGGGGGAFVELHRNFMTWSVSPAGWKRRLMAEVEPGSLSMQATKVMVKRGGKEPPQQDINELWETVSERYLRNT